MTDAVRVVFDCNVFLQALISPGGPAGRCVTLSFQGEIALYCTDHIIDELEEDRSR